MTDHLRQARAARDKALDALNRNDYEEARTWAAIATAEATTGLLAARQHIIVHQPPAPDPSGQDNGTGPDVSDFLANIGGCGTPPPGPALVAASEPEDNGGLTDREASGLGVIICRFAEDTTLLHPTRSTDTAIPATTLYDAYTTWCGHVGNPPYSRGGFIARFRAAGFLTGRDAPRSPEGLRTVAGLTLRPEWNPNR